MSTSDNTNPSLEAHNRRALFEVQREMLSRAPCFTSHELTTGQASTTTDSNKLGSDLRRSGKVFAVCRGQSWYYPKFQFDHDGLPFSEMSEVLTALRGDERGWDRLQWFLEPHLGLDGRTPLEVWQQGQRAAVIGAARAETWSDRD